MEEKGLIERRMLDGNRRTFYIFMTDEGSRLKDLVEDNFASIEKKPSEISALKSRPLLWKHSQKYMKI